MQVFELDFSRTVILFRGAAEPFLSWKAQGVPPISKFGIYIHK